MAVLALVRADETIVEFLVKTHAIHYFRSKAYVLAGFAPFGCRKCTIRHRVLGCRFATSSGRRNYCRVFWPKKHPFHNFTSKTHVLGRFAPFGCGKCTVATSVPRMPFCHEFEPTKLLSSSWSKRMQSTTVGPRLTFWLVSPRFW